MEADGNTHNQEEEKDAGTSPPAKLVLYSFWQSSCSWRVRFALKLKGLAYEYKAVDLVKGEQLSPEFQRLNPLGYVPVLVDGGVVISDSFGILMYLEDKYPQNTLLPEDPQLRALNLQAAAVVTSSIQPLHMQSLLKYIEDKFGPEERSLWAKTHIEKGLLALEKLLKDFAGRYATGDSLYLADVFLAPQIAVAVYRFKIDITQYPTLCRVHESYKTVPEFLASIPEAQPDAPH